MKKTIVALLCLTTFWSCKKSNPGKGENENSNGHLTEDSRFLVDKVYDYHNNLIAEYIYDDKDRLVKRKFTDPETGAKSDYDLQYENGKVKKISYTDYSFPEFNHNIIMTYNLNNQIIRDETYNNGLLTVSRNYSYYENGKIKGIFNDSDLEYCTIEYLNTNNALQSVWKLHDEDGMGLKYKEIAKTFTYDNHPKPNFGIGNIFQFDPLPKSNATAPFENAISENNMTGADDGTTWTYEYNEDNLPATIEVKWKDIETEEPMLLRIRYKSRN